MGQQQQPVKGSGAMPKEIAWSNDPSLVEVDGNEIPADQAPAGQGLRVYQRGAVVRWGKQGIDRVELGVAKLETATNIEYDHRYLSLDRAGLNRLIRSLRTARDHAFGRDE